MRTWSKTCVLYAAASKTTWGSPLFLENTKCISLVRKRNLLNGLFLHNLIFFAEREKDHKSHDILILCLSCNMRLDNVQLNMRRSLAETCNAPIACRQHSPFINDVELSKVLNFYYYFVRLLNFLFSRSDLLAEHWVKVPVRSQTRKSSSYKILLQITSRLQLPN